MRATDIKDRGRELEGSRLLQSIMMALSLFLFTLIWRNPDICVSCSGSWQPQQHNNILAINESTIFWICNTRNHDCASCVIKRGDADMNTRLWLYARLWDCRYESQDTSCKTGEVRRLNSMCRLSALWAILRVVQGSGSLKTTPGAPLDAARLPKLHVRLIAAWDSRRHHRPWKHLSLHCTLIPNFLLLPDCAVRQSALPITSCLEKIALTHTELPD